MKIIKYSIIDDTIGKIAGKTVSTSVIPVSSNVGITRLSTVAKVSLLNLLAGYYSKELITVEGEDLNKYIDVDNFASLNLNIINAGPMNFNVHVVFSKNNAYRLGGKTLKKTDIDFDTILLASGGIDSASGLFYCLDHNIKVLPVWIDFGQKNRVNEKKSVSSLCRKLDIPLVVIRVGIKKYVDSGWKIWKYGIIPSRNFMLVALSSLLIERMTSNNIRILLCATRDEYNSRHQDKSPEFYKTISKLLSGTTRKRVTVETPFGGYNKTEIISYWQKRWKDKYRTDISDTISCYSNDYCGVCPACYNRRIYGAVAGYYNDVVYKNNPFNDGARMIRDYHMKNYQSWNHTRKLDFLIALQRNRVVLPPEVRLFLSQNYQRMHKQIVARKKYLKNLEIS